MRFFSAASAALAFAASAFAQTKDFNPVYSPAEDQAVQAGQPFKVTWSAPPKYADGKVTISLIGGADQNTLVPLGNIATGIDNSAQSYTWNVDSALGDKATYGLVFKWENDPTIFQYSMRFTIKGGNPKPSSSSAGSSAPAPTGPVVTTATGIKTVTLTSCPPDAVTSHANGTASWSTKVWNTTVVAPTHIPTGGLPTTTKGGNGGFTSAPAPIPTAAAPHFGAGVLAVFGGVAAALLL